MASRISQEEENYVRMSLLLTGISPRAARVLFDSEFSPTLLNSSLKKEFNTLKDLQKKRIINQSQWNLLFPRFPDVLDSKTFDVTLMIVLLRNLTNLNPPYGGYDILPSPSEVTPTSDLARIKYYRNIVAHLDEGRIDNYMFNKAWDDITGVSTLKQYHIIPFFKELDETLRIVAGFDTNLHNNLSLEQLMAKLN
ncbi:Hypothetical predicted protein [Mytilus galloprovincialis]|uniref:DZIP3-like HEPN domain-containing protein n=1 Tax=Mytilus galloprovincialis TaxID=29158 RepID=A0A8B6F7R1_MYTGA|nr:Hypothetical predicted protein [Mytilus galloprovincialis]